MLIYFNLELIPDYSDVPTPGCSEIRSARMEPYTLPAVLVALTLLPDAPAECVTAAKDYAAVLDAVTVAVRAYERCVGTSQGRNRCADEIDDLDGTHRDFEDAVAEFQRACPLALREPR